MREIILEAIVVSITAMVIFFGVDIVLDKWDSWMAWLVVLGILILAIVAAEFVLDKI